MRAYNRVQSMFDRHSLRAHLCGQREKNRATCRVAWNMYNIRRARHAA